MTINKIKIIVKKSISFIRKHKIISIIIFLLIAGLLFVLRSKPPKPVSTEKVAFGDIVQSLSITGTVSSERFVDLTFPVGGKLASLGIQKGDTVSQNQVIATLDQNTALKNLKTALLNYSIQRNTFDQSNGTEKPADALNDTVRRVLQNNQYNLDLAVNSVELQDLARQESILITPISGIVTRTDVKTAGINITPTTTFSIVDPTTLSFRMEIDEADISKVKPGQEVEVNLDSYPDKTLRLTVESIDFVTHTTSTGGNAYDVKAKIPSNNTYQYRVGMNGNATIITNKKRNVIKIPLSSLNDDNSVYVKVGNSYEKRSIKLGLQNDTDTEVVSGLSANDLLVTDPGQVPVKK